METIKPERTVRSMCSTKGTLICTFEVPMKWFESHDLILYTKSERQSDGMF